VNSWSWDLSKSKTFPAQYLRIWALGFIYWVWGRRT
jgi:hypothetical protein